MRSFLKLYAVNTGVRRPFSSMPEAIIPTMVAVVHSRCDRVRVRCTGFGGLVDHPQACMRVKKTPRNLPAVASSCWRTPRTKKNIPKLFLASGVLFFFAGPLPFFTSPSSPLLSLSHTYRHLSQQGPPLPFNSPAQACTLCKVAGSVLHQPAPRQETARDYTIFALVRDLRSRCWSRRSLPPPPWCCSSRACRAQPTPPRR